MSGFGMAKVKNQTRKGAGEDETGESKGGRKQNGINFFFLLLFFSFLMDQAAEITKPCRS
jgi:hypothetical protein